MTKTLSINELYENLKNFTPWPLAGAKADPQITKKSKYHKLFYCGVHLGHKSLKVKSAWHSSISTFLLGSRNNSAILKNKYTLTCFLKAFYILTLIVKSGGHILIINTNPEFSKLLQHIKKNTKSSKIFYSDCHWVGGTLTNWAQIYQSISTFISFYHRFDDFLLKNNIHFPRYKKMKKSFKGFVIKKKTSLKPLILDTISKNEITNLDSVGIKQREAILEIHQQKVNELNRRQLNKGYTEKTKFILNSNSFLEPHWKPDLLFILDSNGTEGIIREASSLQIPIIALIDSNTNISNITYPIPTTNNSFLFAWFCLDWITRIINKYSARHVRQKI